MKNSKLRWILVLAGLALTGPLASAQLLLSGFSWGAFHDPSPPYPSNLIFNGVPISIFSSGVPLSGSPKTSATFTGKSFLNIGDGDIFKVGNLKFVNGDTALGSTATSVELDVFANFTSIGVFNVHLTTLDLLIDNTPNMNVGVPDLFLASYSPLASFVYDDTLVSFSLLVMSDPSFFVAPGRTIPERLNANEDIYLQVNFTPVPEPSTYAACGALLLMGLVARRRFKAGRHPTAP